ncbi:MAG: hypothetical protein H7X93_07975, partial [Sphingomonadaceae bacterium]|nr:hypothetical protein [Sphingomonadaceae bacterium]
MKLVSKLALGAALCTGISGLALAPAQAQPAAEEAVEFDAGEISEPVRAPVAAAQAALAAEPKDTATALSQTQSAVPLIVNDDDRFIVGQMLIQVGAAMQTAGAADAQVMPLLLQGAQLSLQSNRVEIARRPALYILIGNDAQEREDWPAALAAYENALRYGPQNADAAIQVANVQFRSNNIQAGYATIDRAIELKRASGQPVPDNWIMVPLRYAAEARDLARFNTYSEMLLRAYGTEPDRWHDILFSYQNLAALDDQANLDMFRLARATRSIQEPNEFQEYVVLATTHGLPGEAQAAQNAGIAASAWPAGAEPTA